MAGFEGKPLEAHQLDTKTAKKIPKMIGRSLSVAETTALLGKMR
jgi:hypothetical protein